MLEVDLSPPVIEWLKNRGFAVYCEVRWMGRSIDVVAISDSAVEVVELKTSLTEVVFRQAMMATLCADRVWCAVGKRPRSTIRKDYHRQIGVLLVEPPAGVSVLREPEPGSMIASPAYLARIRESCALMTPGTIAGMPTNRGVGPAQECFDRISEYRQGNPSASWREIYHAVPNHYSHHQSLQGAMRVVRDVRERRRREAERHPH